MVMMSVKGVNDSDGDNVGDELVDGIGVRLMANYLVQ